jgi:hypothetical protein
MIILALCAATAISAWREAARKHPIQNSGAPSAINSAKWITRIGAISEFGLPALFPHARALLRDKWRLKRLLLLVP